MAVKLIAKEKAKKVSPSKQEELDVGIATTVEKLAAAKKKVDEFKAAEKAYEALRNELLALIPEDASVEEEYVFSGITHRAVFTAKSQVRSVKDMKKLRKALGDEVFFGIISVNMGDVDKYLSEQEQEGIVEKARTGYRKCSVKEM